MSHSCGNNNNSNTNNNNKSRQSPFPSLYEINILIKKYTGKKKNPSNSEFCFIQFWIIEADQEKTKQNKLQTTYLRAKTKFCLTNIARVPNSAWKKQPSDPAKH